jgi:hypothetical protein
MPKHYVTFGQTMVHSINGKTLDKDTVAVYEASSHKDSRDKAFEYFGSNFFTDYHGDEWDESEKLQYFPKGYVELN